MDPQEPNNNPPNAPVGQMIFPREFLTKLAAYVSFNELKRLRTISKDFNTTLMAHPRFLNSTLLMGRKFPEKFAEMRRLKGSDDVLPWSSVVCSFRRLERCEFVRNFWKTRMIQHVRKLELYNIGHKCHVVAHFIGTLPVLEELILNEVSFRSRNVPEVNLQHLHVGNAPPPPIPLFCEHDGAHEVFAYPDIVRDNTIRKLGFRKVPIIPTCLIQYLTVRVAGVLEEFHLLDNRLPVGINENFRPTQRVQDRNIVHMLRINLITLRKLTWANCPVHPDFTNSLGDRVEFPAWNLTDLHIGQFQRVPAWNILHIRQILTIPAIPMQLRKLKLDLWQSLPPHEIQQIHQSIILCRGLTSLSLTLRVLTNGGHEPIEFQPGLNGLEHLREVEIRHRYKDSIFRTNNWSVNDILDNAHLPLNIESLAFCGLFGVKSTSMRNYLNTLHINPPQPLKKLILSDNDHANTRNAVGDATMQMILSKFPLLEELTVSQNERITDEAFTGIPAKSVKLIYESQSYTLLAHAELNLPPRAQSLSNLRRLKKLTLTSINIGDVTLFRALQLPNLRELDLSYTNVTDVGLMQLPIQTPTVEDLTLNCCQNVSALGVCLLLKYSQVQNLTTTQTVIERDHPGLKYSFPVEAAKRSAKIFVEHNPRDGLCH